MSSRVLEEAHRVLAVGRRGAMVTIIETEGSTPRRAGAKMLVRDDGTTVGTVGGGCLEGRLCAAALEAIRTGTVSVHEFSLGGMSTEEDDMVCGGRLKVLVEPLVSEEKLVILGGGHISLALHDMCGRLEYRITVTDDRPEYANGERFPLAERTIAAPFEEQFEQLGIDAATVLVIVTRGHKYDQLCLERALGTPAKFIGMIGSRRKFAVFRKNLLEKGISEEALGRVACPVGIGIGAETPEEIAVSIAAQLIQVRRGMSGPAQPLSNPVEPGDA